MKLYQAIIRGRTVFEPTRSGKYYQYDAVTNKIVSTDLLGAAHYGVLGHVAHSPADTRGSAQEITRGLREAFPFIDRRLKASEVRVFRTLLPTSQNESLFRWLGRASGRSELMDGIKVAAALKQFDL